jgi:hypothetical protein
MRWALFGFLSFASWVIVSAADAADTLESSSSFYNTAKAPSTIPDILRMVKQIADKNLFARDDFYTENHLKSLFGDQPKIEVNQYESETRGWVYGFIELVDPGTPASYLNGVWIEARKGKLSTWPICCDFTVTFRSIARGLDFRSVIDVLGSGWIEDKKAEDEHFVAVTRESFNPPFPRPTGYMGNAIIAYKEPNGSMRLEFSSDGTLFQITYQIPR